MEFFIGAIEALSNFFISILLWLNSHPTHLTILIVFAAVGIFVSFAKMETDEQGIIRSRWEMWISWSLYLSALLTSGFFLVVVIIRALLSLFPTIKDKHAWKLAIAITALLWVLWHTT